MKGIVFNTLNEMVEEKYGLAVWEELLSKVNPESGGIYTSGQYYADGELMLLVNGLAELKQIDPFQLTEDFGLYMFPVLARKYPIFLPERIGLKEFLKSIHNIIHVEVKKLYPEASLPVIEYEDINEDQLVMKYTSPRKLCYLAIGLIKGAAAHFHRDVEIEQPLCMHKNSDHCRLEITIA